MEAALACLQRKEIYLSQTESSEILLFVDSMKITSFKKAHDGSSFSLLEANIQNNFQCPNCSNLELLNRPRVVV